LRKRGKQKAEIGGAERGKKANNISSLLGCNTVQSGTYTATFQKNLLPSISGRYMDISGFSETLVNIYQTIWCCIP